MRPMAFFKSITGQIQLMGEGKPYVMFGDGNLASCKPISEADLARFNAECITQEDKVNSSSPLGAQEARSVQRTRLRDGDYCILPMTDMLFRITGQKPNYFPVPLALFDGIIGFLDLVARLVPKQFEDAAEFGRIGKYYAVESMLVWDPVKQVYVADASPEYGVDTLEAFFTKAVKERLKGQELGDAAVFDIKKAEASN